MNDADKDSAVRPSLDYHQSKIDLAAALRWADHLGYGEGVCNHFSYAIPGTADLFLLNPQGVHWSEVTASDIITVNSEGTLIEGKWPIEPTAFFIHSKIHAMVPSAKCVLHTHMPNATALCALEKGRLLWISQNALRFYDQVTYDDAYNGLALDDSEGNRIAQLLHHKRVLFLANHGVIVTGEDIATAFDDLYYLERTCQVQVLAMSTGSPLKNIPSEICQKAFVQIQEERQQSYLHFEAIKRILKRQDPEFDK
ncbi:MAG: aldolase [Saprospiraceae bacterium]|nr:aldolase [Saprospiraceae bacterium]